MQKVAVIRVALQNVNHATCVKSISRASCNRSLNWKWIMNRRIKSNANPHPLCRHPICSSWQWKYSWQSKREMLLYQRYQHVLYTVDGIINESHNLLVAIYLTICLDSAVTYRASRQKIERFTKKKRRLFSPTNEFREI